MQCTLENPFLDSIDPDSVPAFKVVIAYEDFESGKRAKTTYDFLAETLGNHFQFTNEMWKFEVLGLQNLREMAVRDAIEADAIIVACRSKELPPAVKSWVDELVAGATRAIALVVLCNCLDEDSDRGIAVRSFLAEAARRGDIGFFAQPDQWPGKSSAADATSAQLAAGLEQLAAQSATGTSAASEAPASS